MDHPCHRCNAVIPEGAPFCPQCGAPQIRVSVGSSATAPMPPGTPDEIQPPAQPVFNPGIPWTTLRHSIVLGGILAAVATMFAPLAGLGVLLLATVLIVWLYARRPEATVTGSSGARIGAVTGLTAFLAWVVLFLIAIFPLRQAGQLHELVIKTTREASVNYPASQAAEIMNFVSSSTGFVVFVLLGMVLMLLFSIACGIIAGALSGAAFSRPRH